MLCNLWNTVTVSTGLLLPLTVPLWGLSHVLFLSLTPGPALFAASKSLQSSVSVCVYNTSLLLKQIMLHGTCCFIIIHGNKWPVLSSGVTIVAELYFTCRLIRCSCIYSFPHDNKPCNLNIPHMTGSLQTLRYIMQWMHALTMPFKQIYVLCQCLVSSAENQIPQWSLFMTGVVCINPTKGWM